MLLFLLGCRNHHEVVKTAYVDYKVEEEKYQPDPTIQKLLEPFREKMNAEMNEVIVQSTSDMRMGRPESKLGNFAADATEAMAEFYTNEDVAFAMHNYSGLRIGSIGKGPITIGRIYELMPFDNYLVTVPLSGAEVQQMCNFMASKGGWPSSSSLHYKIQNDLAMDVRIDGNLIEADKTYIMATNDYVVKSANYQDYLAAKEMNNTNIYVRDAVVAYLRNIRDAGNKLEPALDQRVINLDK